MPHIVAPKRQEQGNVVAGGLDPDSSKLESIWPRSLWPVSGWRTLAAMSPLERITVNPSVRFGKPCVRGTRITVGDVLSYLAAGMNEDQIIGEFSQLTREDIRACLAYAAERERRSVSLPAA